MDESGACDKHLVVFLYIFIGSCNEERESLKNKCNIHFAMPGKLVPNCFIYILWIQNSRQCVTYLIY